LRALLDARDVAGYRYRAAMMAHLEPDIPARG
jgi:hypothetical protein